MTALTNSDLNHLQEISAFFAVLFGVSAATAFFIEKAYPNSARKVRDFFSRAWAKIDGTVWLKLVRLALEQTILFKNSFSDTGFSQRLLSICFAINAAIGLGIIAIVVPITAYELFSSSVSEDSGNLPIRVLFIVLGLAWAISCGIASSKITDLSESGSAFDPSDAEIVVLFLNVPLFFGFLYIIIYEISIFAFPILVVLAFPIIYSTLSLVIAFLGKMLGGNLSDKILRNFAFYSMAIICSFGLTFFAFLIGHIFEPGAWIPRTIQLLIANIIFDTLTIFFTFLLIEWSINRRNMLLVLPIVIVLDLAIAAILACGSIYCGLLLTSEQLTFGQAIEILVGNYPDGRVGLNLGPYFWAMHTVFIPTIIYMILIIVFWCAKAFLILIHSLLGAARQHERPLEVTSYFLTIFTVFFTTLVPYIETLKSP
ncbi:MAG: hypothetical protein MI785_06120 [Kiloniellales bacterium]|nr:hypothetical protein [Kiloniellales bacterium]